MRTFAFQHGVLFVVAWGFFSTSVLAGEGGTTFIYQGQVTQDGLPLNDTADFQFSLWDVEGGGSSNIGPFVNRDAVPVVNGLFQVELDFGAEAFHGDPRWLQVAVRSPAGGGSYAILSPRQPIRSAPQAIQTRGIQVDANGNVGLGTAPAPGYRLHVVETEANADLHLQSTNNGATDRARIWLTTGERQWNIENDGGADVFKIRDNSPGVTSDRLAIDFDGYVGIGTTDPAQKLDVRGQVQVQDSIRLDAADKPLIVRQWNPMTSGPRAGFGRWGLFQEFTTLFLGVPSTDFAGGSSITFGGWREDSTRDTWMKIEKGGNVGIGTQSPNVKLDVAGDGQFTGGDLRIWFGDKALSLRQDSDNTYISNKANFVNNGAASNGRLVLNGEGGVQLKYGSSGSSGSDGLVLNTEGRIGIGASSPLARLDVRDGTTPSATPGEASLVPTIYGLSTNGGSSSYVPVGVLGWTDDEYGVGVVGVTNHPDGVALASIGDFVAVGAKSFAQPHPLDASKEIRFVALEGNESGTYFRGSAQLNGGRIVIHVPEDFRNATNSQGLTVQVTALGPNAELWVESKDLNRIVVRGNGDAAFDYFVNGVRRGFAEFKTVRENRHFVPTAKGKPFLAQLPDAARRILIENGTLNDDFTPNEQTAAQMGWKLNEPRRDTD